MQTFSSVCAIRGILFVDKDLNPNTNSLVVVDGRDRFWPDSDGMDGGTFGDVLQAFVDSTSSKVKNVTLIGLYAGIISMMVGAAHKNICYDYEMANGAPDGMRIADVAHQAEPLERALRKSAGFLRNSKLLYNYSTR
jgi:hypothetical protein